MKPDYFLVTNTLDFIHQCVREAGRPEEEQGLFQASAGDQGCERRARQLVNYLQVERPDRQQAGQPEEAAAFSCESWISERRRWSQTACPLQHVVRYWVVRVRSGSAGGDGVVLQAHARDQGGKGGTR